MSKKTADWMVVCLAHYCKANNTMYMDKKDLQKVPSYARWQLLSRILFVINVVSMSAIITIVVEFFFGGKSVISETFLNNVVWIVLPLGVLIFCFIGCEIAKSTYHGNCYGLLKDFRRDKKKFEKYCGFSPISDCQPAVGLNVAQVLRIKQTKMEAQLPKSTYREHLHHDLSLTFKYGSMFTNIIEPKSTGVGCKHLKEFADLFSEQV